MHRHHAPGEVRVTRGMISAPHPAAAAAGLQMLKLGGNAIDAAVAAGYALTVVLPASTGIAGYGGAMMLYLADRKLVTSVDFNCRAPRAAREDMFRVREEPGGGFSVEESANVVGPRSIAVPGIAAGLDLALRRYGTLPPAAVLRPAIEIAREGFVIDRYTAAFIEATLIPNAARFPETFRAYAIDGRAPQPGETLRLPELADTLSRLRDGPDAFYRGEIAAAIAGALEKAGGLVTEADLARYAAHEQTPSRVRYRDYDVWAPGLPGGGLGVLQMLRVLDGFHVPGAEAEFAHLLIEVAKPCWRERLLRYGDPDFVAVSDEGELQDDVVQRLRADARAGVAAPAPGSVVAPDPITGTVHLCAADREGNIASLTHTQGGSFGSLMLVPGTGVLLNHGLSRFDPRPGRPNSIGPWKRPLHNMAPALIFKTGRPLAALGASGGRTIINSLVQTIARVVDRKETPDASIVSPRFHVETAEPVLVETGGEALAGELRRIGHRAEFRPSFGSLQAICFSAEPCAMTGVADPRRAGTVAWV